MANTVLKYGIIDSGLNFVDPAYSKAYELVADKFKAIKLTAALDKHASVALAFRFNYLNIEADVEKLNENYYVLGSEEGKIRGTSTTDGIPTGVSYGDYSLISWAQIFSYGSSAYNIDSDLLSPFSYGCGFGRVFLDETNIGYGNEILTKTTNVEYDSNDTLEESLQKIITSTSGTTEYTLQNLACTFHNTLTHYTNNCLEFISLDQLDWINNNGDKFFNALSSYLSHYKLHGVDIGPDLLSLVMIVFAVSEEGSSDPLPLSTIKSLVVYK